MQVKLLQIQQLITLCQDKGVGGGEWRSEGGRVKTKERKKKEKKSIYGPQNEREKKKISKLISLHHRPSLNIHPCPQAGGAPGRVTRQTMQTF